MPTSNANKYQLNSSTNGKQANEDNNANKQQANQLNVQQVTNHKQVTRTRLTIQQATSNAKSNTKPNVQIS
jgi:hypothetical protein